MDTLPFRLVHPSSRLFHKSLCFHLSRPNEHLTPFNVRLLNRHASCNHVNHMEVLNIISLRLSRNTECPIGCYPSSSTMDDSNTVTGANRHMEGCSIAVSGCHALIEALYRYPIQCHAKVLSLEHQIVDFLCHHARVQRDRSTFSSQELSHLWCAAASCADWSSAEKLFDVFQLQEALDIHGLSEMQEILVAICNNYRDKRDPTSSPSPRHTPAQRLLHEKIKENALWGFCETALDRGSGAAPLEGRADLGTTLQILFSLSSFLGCIPPFLRPNDDLVRFPHSRRVDPEKWRHKVLLPSPPSLFGSFNLLGWARLVMSSYVSLLPTYYEENYAILRTLDDAFVTDLWIVYQSVYDSVQVAYFFTQLISYISREFDIAYQFNASLVREELSAKNCIKMEDQTSPNLKDILRYYHLQCVTKYILNANGTQNSGNTDSSSIQILHAPSLNTLLGAFISTIFLECDATWIEELGRQLHERMQVVFQFAQSEQEDVFVDTSPLLIDRKKQLHRTCVDRWTQQHAINYAVACEKLFFDPEFKKKIKTSEAFKESCLALLASGHSLHGEALKSKGTARGVTYLLESCQRISSEILGLDSTCVELLRSHANDGFSADQLRCILEARTRPPTAASEAFPSSIQPLDCGLVNLITETMNHLPQRYLV